MENKYLDRDFVQKIDATLVRFKGKVYYARVDGTQINLYSLQDVGKVVMKVPAKHVDLDVSSVPLGYFNLSANNSAIYVVRNPVRKTKQGVSVQNVTCWIPAESKFTTIPSEYLLSPSVDDGFEGKYPSLASAVGIVRKGWKSCALGPEVCIVEKDAQRLSVFFKRDHVGYYTPANNVVSIPNSLFSVMMSKFVGKYGWFVE